MRGEREMYRKNDQRSNGWKSPNLMKNINLHIQEAWWNVRRVNTKKYTLRYLMVKMLKGKEKMLKTARENNLPHTMKPQLG